MVKILYLSVFIRIFFLPKVPKNAKLAVMKLTLAARKSHLARYQAYTVGSALQQAHPTLEIEYRFSQSFGDQNPDINLAEVEQKGVFTKDFYEHLVSGEIDLVVHSWKDLPVEESPDTEIYATLKREDPRDMLLVKKSKWEEVKTSKRIRLGSSSPRRTHNLTPFLKKYLPCEIDEVEFSLIRGNIPTRLEKTLADDSLDGFVIAKAALDRLLTPLPFEDLSEYHKKVRFFLEQYQWMVLPVKLIPPAAAQGALAIEIRKDNTELKKLLDAINDVEEKALVEKERELLKSFGGGCQLKIGIHVGKHPHGTFTSIRGESAEGEELLVQSLENNKTETSTEPKNIWPEDPKEASFFTRKDIPAVNPEKPLWVARANALPNDWKVNQVVWTAGLKTWAQLAKRGVWVHGSNESLGEALPTRIEKLLDETKIPWVKLTHKSGVQNENFSNLATYELEEKDLSSLPLKDKTHFYWMSGSSYLAAQKAFPAIKEAQHGCGPGNTFNIIRETTENVEVFLDYKDWKSHILKENSHG